MNIPGALRHPKIATIATKKTAGIMRMEEFMVLCGVCVSGIGFEGGSIAGKSQAWLGGDAGEGLW
jgi:hypothetical protein